MNVSIEAKAFAAQALREAAATHEEIASKSSYVDAEPVTQAWLDSAAQLRVHADTLDTP